LKRSCSWSSKRCSVAVKSIDSSRSGFIRHVPGPVPGHLPFALSMITCHSVCALPAIRIVFSRLNLALLALSYKFKMFIITCHSHGLVRKIIRSPAYAINRIGLASGKKALFPVFYRTVDVMVSCIDAPSNCLFTRIMRINGSKARLKAKGREGPHVVGLFFLCIRCFYSTLAPQVYSLKCLGSVWPTRKQRERSETEINVKMTYGRKDWNKEQKSLKEAWKENRYEGWIAPSIRRQ
jgi:hypothetical protein